MIAADCGEYRTNMALVKKRNKDELRDLAYVVAWAMAFLACILAYLPGLNGPFVFDDFASIDTLGDLGGVSDWDTFKAFVLGGTAGPTGRPLALLSFLIDGNTWPTDPWPFKRTNLLIHLINGALLGVLISKILNALDFEKHDTRWIALLSAACWLLHPFLVSTTLYVVQRMAQLSTLFIFAGLIVHLYARTLMARDARKAYLIMTLSVGLLTLLAMLSKENGILLPILIGVLEFTVLASAGKRFAALDWRWSAVFIIAPASIIVAYLGAKVANSNFFEIVPPRDFSIYERVLTQPRVLIDYLQNWFVPKLYTTGVFQDHFIKSTGVLSPITTLLSAILHIAIIALAIVNRRKWPLLALAALFFYAGHLLESTVLNLELYFEHRNYLPACFLFLPLIVFLWQRMSRQLLVVTALSIIMVLSGFTHYSATVWQNFSSMVEASAQKAPTSARAQADYAKALYNSGRYEDSLRVMDRAIENIPADSPHLLVNRLTMHCNLNSLDANEFGRVAKVLSNTIYDPRLTSIYFEFVSAVTERKCTDVSLDALRAMFADMLSDPWNSDIQSSRYAQLKYIVGFIDVFKAAPEQAVKEFEESLRAIPDAAKAMNMAALLASKRFFAEALYLSNFALSEQYAGVSEDDVRAFQALVHADMSQLPENDNSRPVP